MIHVAQASTDSEIAAVRALFEEYAAWLDVDLCFQGFAVELASLPGSYAPPRGRLLLATSGGVPVGCIALRPLNDGVCEMKRLYVKTDFRGRGLGKILIERIIADAREIGYVSIRLDTLPSMIAATRLYESFGFVRAKSYYETPLDETIFMELQLSKP